MAAPQFFPQLFRFFLSFHNFYFTYPEVCVGVCVYYISATRTNNHRAGSWRRWRYRMPLAPGLILAPHSQSPRWPDSPVRTRVSYGYQRRMAPSRYIYIFLFFCLPTRFLCIVVMIANLTVGGHIPPRPSILNLWPQPPPLVSFLRSRSNIIYWSSGIFQNEILFNDDWTTYVCVNLRVLAGSPFGCWDRGVGGSLFGSSTFGLSIERHIIGRLKSKTFFIIRTCAGSHSILLLAPCFYDYKKGEEYV